jgi:hypothetical protein
MPVLPKNSEGIVFFHLILGLYSCHRLGNFATDKLYKI